MKNKLENAPEEEHIALVTFAIKRGRKVESYLK